MSTRVTTIDHSGKYLQRSETSHYGSVHTTPDGRYFARDPDGKRVTDLGALVVFDDVESAMELLRGRNGS